MVEVAFRAPAAGDYDVAVSDADGQGGAAYFYALQVRKNIENWAVWVVVNLVAVVSYWSAELAFTAFLYAVYLVMAFAGWWDWHRAMKGTVASPQAFAESR